MRLKMMNSPTRRVLQIDQFKFNLTEFWPAELFKIKRFAESCTTTTKISIILILNNLTTLSVCIEKTPGGL